MDISKINFSCVIVGRWNRGILTPSWVAKKLFDLSDGAAIQLEVPLDYLMPIRMKHENIYVVASETKLTIEVEEKYCSRDKIEKSLRIALKLLETLPETPINATGINFRYDIQKEEHFVKKLSTKFDNDISDGGYEIEGRGIFRKVKYEGGNINVNIRDENKDSVEISFNFECVSQEISDIKKWVSLPIDSLISECDKIENMLTRNVQ